MTLLNAGMIFGILLVAVPIVLHMTMRPKPRVVLFPAIRFVKPRVLWNERQLRWKQWVLLVLRCLLIALLAVALARPSTVSHLVAQWAALGVLALGGLLLAALAAWVIAVRRSRILAVGLAAAAVLLLGSSVALAIQVWRKAPPLWGSQQAPVAAVFVFDTAPRMSYVSENRTRLQQAAQIAEGVLRQLPAESVVAVFDSQTRAAAFSLDIASAAKAIQRLQVCYAPRPWQDVVIDALHLLDTATQEHKEIYLFSDLNAHSWNDQSIQAIREAADARPMVSWYLIDVGVPSPKNVALSPPVLSHQVLPRDGPLTITTTLHAEGISAERIVELYIEPPDPHLPVFQNGRTVRPEPQLRGSRTQQVESGRRVALEFQVQGLPQGVVHGYLRLVGEDGLAIDDERYFAVHVQDGWPVLLAAPQDVSLRFIAEALAPYELRQRQAARFDCMQVRIEDLSRHDLGRYAAVVLADPPPLEATVWKQLSEYVKAGRGLAVLLGHHATTGEFASPEAQPLLGIIPRRVVRTGGRDVFLAPHNLQHPVFHVFREIATAVPWDLFPVFRHWDVELTADTVHVLAYFNNGKPALLENAFGAGKVLVLTTPLSDIARPPGRSPWNELAFGENPWPQFVLLNEMMLYLVAAGKENMNLYCGEPAILSLRPQSDPQVFRLFPPAGDPYDVRASETDLVVRFTDTPGNYYLKGERGGVVQRGFAVNVAESLTDLTRADPEKIQSGVGRQRLRILKKTEQIERAQGVQRFGREFYPLLITLVALLFGIEQAFANRFYRRVDV